LYDIAVAANLMMSQVSYTRGNMYKLQKCMYVTSSLTDVWRYIRTSIRLGVASSAANDVTIRMTS